MTHISLLSRKVVQMKNLMRLVTFVFCIALFVADASAQCDNGNCSNRNATLGESISSIPVPQFTTPAPAPQIAYYTAPSGAAASASSSASGNYVTTPGQLVVAGYTAPPQMAPAPQIAYYTIPVQNGASASASTSTPTAPQLIGSSTQVACQNGCSGRRFTPFQNLRARRTGNFAKSVAISRG